MVPLSQVRATFPVLKNPANRHRAVGFTPEQWHYAFTNTLSEEESRALYERYPSRRPGRIFWGSALANLHPGTGHLRGLPQRRRAPCCSSRAARTTSCRRRSSVQRRHYKSETVTEVREFEGPHLLPAAPGWRRSPTSALTWRSSTRRRGRRASPRLDDTWARRPAAPVQPGHRAIRLKHDARVEAPCVGQPQSPSSRASPGKSRLPLPSTTGKVMSRYSSTSPWAIRVSKRSEGRGARGRRRPRLSWRPPPDIPGSARAAPLSRARELLRRRCDERDARESTRATRTGRSAAPSPRPRSSPRRASGGRCARPRGSRTRGTGARPAAWP